MIYTDIEAVELRIVVLCRYEKKPPNILFKKLIIKFLHTKNIMYTTMREGLKTISGLLKPVFGWIFF